MPVRLYLVTLAALVALALPSRAAAQSHPCDTAPVGPFVVMTGSKPTVGWCYNPTVNPVAGWKIVVDNGTPFKLAALAVKQAANAAGLAYFEAQHPTPIAKGAHTAGVFAYRVDPTTTLDVDGTAASVPFDAVDPVSAPPAPTFVRVK